jgi:hypothetical protein
MSVHEEFIDEDSHVDDFFRLGNGNDDGEFTDHEDAEEDDDDVDDSAALVAAYYKRIISQLRTNDPSILHAGRRGKYFVISSDLPDLIRVDLAEALTQNTDIQRIMLQLEDYRQASAEAMVKYLAQSKSLLSVDLRGQSLGIIGFLFGMGFMQDRVFSTFIEAIGHSTSIKNLDLEFLGLGLASEAFENLLTRTGTLRYLKVDSKRCPPLTEEETTAIASGFSKNTTLQKIKLVDWQEEGLAPVLTALQDHPVLEILHVEGFQSLTGIDGLMRSSSNNSRVKELTIQRFNGFDGEQLVGFESFMQEMGRNTTVLKLAIVDVPLSRDNIQQLKAMLRRNTVLEDLNVAGAALRSTGLAEIASVLYRNTNIQGLDVSSNGLGGLVLLA